MSTRADFYVGKGQEAEWLGSFAFDGYPDGAVQALADCATEAEWRIRVTEFLQERHDSTMSSRGWPWPWDDSSTTDYAYTWHEGVVWWCNFGYAPWRALAAYESYEYHKEDRNAGSLLFPDMSGRKNVRFDALGAGIILIESRR